MQESLEERVARLEREVEALKRELRRTLSVRESSEMVVVPPAATFIGVLGSARPMLSWFDRTAYNPISYPQLDGP